MSIATPGNSTAEALPQTYVEAGQNAIAWRSKANQFGASLIDQGLAVGGLFIANVVLARVQSKAEYGAFALSYSGYTFIAAVHNALILEPYSIYGGGRYHDRFLNYSRHMFRNNALLAGLLAASLCGIWLAVWHFNPGFASRPLLGLAFAAPILLTALFVRRTFYLRRSPELAARLSVISFLVLVSLLALATRAHLLNGLTTFFIAGIAWVVAGTCLASKLPGIAGHNSFSQETPGHLNEHWKYARWVLATAFVFQLTNQGYYWLLAGFMSVKQVAELRAMYILLAPVDQIFIALDLLVLPAMAFHYASRQNRQLSSLWMKFGASTLLISSCYAACMWAVGHRLLHSVYAGKFDDIATLFVFMALLPIIMSVGNSFNVALKSIERPDLVFRSYVISGAVTLIVGVPIVQHLGLRGAIIGMIASAMAYTVAMLVGLLQASSHILWESKRTGIYLHEQ